MRGWPAWMDGQRSVEDPSWVIVAMQSSCLANWADKLPFCLQEDQHIMKKKSVPLESTVTE